MAERTVLDFYRHEVDSPRDQHYAHWTPNGRRVLTTEQFFEAIVDGLETEMKKQGLA